MLTHSVITVAIMSFHNRLFQQLTRNYPQSQDSLKVHKHEIFFLTFFAETETLWSQGPVTRDF